MRNKQMSQKRYIVEQYFGLSHLHRAFRAWFTKSVAILRIPFDGYYSGIGTI